MTHIWRFYVSTFKEKAIIEPFFSSPKNLVNFPLHNSFYLPSRGIERCFFILAVVRLLDLVFKLRRRQYKWTAVDVLKAFFYVTAEVNVISDKTSTITDI